MMQFLQPWLTEIVSFVAGMAGGSFLTLRMSRVRQYSRGGSSVYQSDITAQGDVVAGSKISSTTRSTRGGK